MNLNKINKDVNIQQVNEALNDSMQVDDQIHDKKGQVARVPTISLLDEDLDYR